MILIPIFKVLSSDLMLSVPMIYKGSEQYIYPLILFAKEPFTEKHLIKIDKIGRKIVL